MVGLRLLGAWPTRRSSTANTSLLEPLRVIVPAVYTASPTCAVPQPNQKQARTGKAARAGWFGNSEQHATTAGTRSREAVWGGYVKPRCAAPHLERSHFWANGLYNARAVVAHDLGRRHRPGVTEAAAHLGVHGVQASGDDSDEDVAREQQGPRQVHLGDLVHAAGGGHDREGFLRGSSSGEEGSNKSPGVETAATTAGRTVTTWKQRVHVAALRPTKRTSAALRWMPAKQTHGAAAGRVRNKHTRASEQPTGIPCGLPAARSPTPTLTRQHWSWRPSPREWTRRRRTQPAARPQTVHVSTGRHRTR